MWKQFSSVGNMTLEPFYIVVSINSVWLSVRAAQQGGNCDLKYLDVSGSHTHSKKVFLWEVWLFS